MTSPRPRLIFVGLPVRESVDMRLTLVSEKIELTVELLMVEMAKLGAFRVLTLMVDMLAVLAATRSV
jgi:hypothetical protein